jgi:ketol-acid reductoisomerase
VHPIEEVGRRVRKMMPWINSGDADYTEGTAAR